MDNTKGQTYDLGERNILEDFYELIENHRLGENRDFQLGDFYDYLNEFDVAYQKFNIQNEGKESVDYVYKYLKQLLLFFLVIFKVRGFSDRPVFYAFKRFIRLFKLILENNYILNSEPFFSKNILKNFSTITEGEFGKFLIKHEIDVNNLGPFYYAISNLIDAAEEFISIDLGIETDKEKGGEKGIVQYFYIYGDDFSVTEILVNSRNDEFKQQGVTYEMAIEIELRFRDNDGAKLINSLNHITASLSNISNTKIIIEEIKTGSLYARIRVYMKDLVAKEETKALIEASKEIVVETLTADKVSYAESRKPIVEARKLSLEEEMLRNDIVDKSDEFESKISKALDLEKRALENEQLRAQVTKDKLEVLTRLSELSAKGILDTDFVRIGINEVFYVLKDGKRLENPNIDIDNIT